MDETKLLEELRGVTEPIVAEIKEIRGKLVELEKRETDVNDDRVVKLEAKLDEALEELRLAQQSVVGPEKKAGDKQDLDSVILGVAAHANPEFRKNLKAKRAIDTSVLATAGKLNPDQAAAFIDLFVNQSQFLQRVRRRNMTSDSALIEEILISNRKIRLATEATAPAVSDSISTKKRTLNAKEIIWAEDITLQFLEDNIERRGAFNHITSLLARAFANDVTDLGLNGDEANADNFLKVNNGWLKIIGTDSPNTVDATGATKPSAVFRSLIDKFPHKYQGLDLTFIVPPETANAYADEQSARETNLGDTAFLNGPQLRYFGRPIYVEGLIHQTAPADRKVVLLPFENLVFGVHRDVTFDAEWKPRRRLFEITISARQDYEIVSEVVTAIASNVPDL